MKSRGFSLFTLLVGLVLIVCLASCSSGSQENAAAQNEGNTSANAISLKVGGNEVDPNNFANSVFENELAAKEYVGKSVEAVATVISVKNDTFSVDTAPDHSYTPLCRNGFLEADLSDKCKVDVEIGEDTSVAASLKTGDTVRISGTISGFSTHSGINPKTSETAEWLTLGLICTESDMVPHGTTTIEKL